MRSRLRLLREELATHGVVVLIPGHPFILDDARMRQPLDEVDLLHKLRNFLLLESFKPGPSHSFHLPGVQVGCVIDSAKLSSPKQLPSC